ncbi:MAG: family 10 glycosylhydrolase [Clostridia bacterium]|nr:family 10 glycosylhydrolase [Clostridia bacterium]
MKKLLSVVMAFLLLCLAACDSGVPEGGSSMAESSEESREETPVGTEETIKLGKQEKQTVQGINQSPTAAGIYVYTDPAFDLTLEGEYTDVAAVNQTVVQIGRAPYVPEDGFVVRFYGCDPGEVALGDTARFSGGMPVQQGEWYVTFGEDLSVRVGYTNTTRTEEAIGFLFDGGWYSDTTCSNIWGTEIAVENGVVVEINPSGKETSGNTKIPENGYVLAVGAGSSYESQILRKVKVGDKATYTRRTVTYAAEKLEVGTVNEQPGDVLPGVFTNSYSQRTPLRERSTEILVDSKGVIVEILTESSGGTDIPRGGMAVFAQGTWGKTLASRAQKGMTCLLKNKVLFLLETPESFARRLEEEMLATEAAYQAMAASLAHISYKEADTAIGEAKAAMEALEASFTREALLTAEERVKRAQSLCVPSLTLQNREAWVTVGELNYDGSPLLHYTNEDTVRWAVQYAKSVGLNTLIVDNTAYGWAAYDSAVPGMVMHPALNGFDVLEAFSRICKEEGLRLIVMVNGFSSAIASVEHPKEHYVNLYSEYLMTSKKGNKVDASGGMTLEPSYSQVQAFNLAVAKELVTKYDLYGIQVDYIRYPLPIYYQAHNYEDFGYECPASEGFAQQYGKDPKTLSINDPLWADWCAYRRDVISGYAKAFYQRVKEAAPHAEVSFTCFAEYTDRQKYVYQDVEKWASEGYADVIYPMIYGNTTEYQLGYAQQIHPVTEDADVVLGVGYYVRASHASIIEQNYMSFGVDAIGVSGFTLRYMSYCGYNDALAQAFRNPATPKGTAQTAEACKQFLAARVESLSYLYDGLDALQTAIASAEATAEGLKKAFEGFAHENEAVQTALEKDLAYALRFLK